MANIEVTRNDDEQRFEAHGGGQLMGFIDFTMSDGVIDLPHTKVYEEFEGQGVGSALVQQTLDQIRAMDDGLKVKPTCPFIDIWMKRHKQYEDLRAE